MKDLEYIIQSSDIPEAIKEHITKNETCFYYILALYHEYLKQLRDLEIKKCENRITDDDFFKQYEILKLGFAMGIASTLDNFINEVGKK